MEPPPVTSHLVTHASEQTHATTTELANLQLPEGYVGRGGRGRDKGQSKLDGSVVLVKHMCAGGDALWNVLFMDIQRFTTDLL